VFAAARRHALDPARPVAERVAALRLLGRDTPARTEDLQRLASLLNPRQPAEIQRAAAHAMGTTGDPTVPALLLADWAAQLPEARSAILDELIGREPWALYLLEKVERSEIDRREIGVARADRLAKHGAEAVKSRAKAVFAATTHPDRQRVIDGFRPALGLVGDAKGGRAVFERVCAACHQLDGIGREIGPNLISVRAHPPEKLLTSILDPSREVEPRYVAYTCTLAGGEELYGLVVGETGNGIDMKLADGTTRTVLRADIASLKGATLSLMPDGLEAGLSHRDVADLIQFLRGGP
jgi:putative heme-binding domain-containing protein